MIKKYSDYIKESFIELLPYKLIKKDSEICHYLINDFILLKTELDFVLPILDKKDIFYIKDSNKEFFNKLEEMINKKYNLSFMETIVYILKNEKNILELIKKGIGIEFTAISYGRYNLFNSFINTSFDTHNFYKYDKDKTTLLIYKNENEFINKLDIYSDLIEVKNFIKTTAIKKAF